MAVEAARLQKRLVRFGVIACVVDLSRRAQAAPLFAAARARVAAGELYAEGQVGRLAQGDVLQQQDRNDEQSRRAAREAQRR